MTLCDFCPNEARGLAYNAVDHTVFPSCGHPTHGTNFSEGFDE